jgi:hypothetical protein
VQAVWSACESCMRACLAIRRLGCDTKRVQRAQRARCRARPPSSPRRCHERSLLCKTNARSILQRCKIFARGLQWGPEATRLRSRLHMQSACHAKPRNGARLRAALAIFFGKANAVHGNRLSGGATGQIRTTVCTVARTAYSTPPTPYSSGAWSVEVASESICWSAQE